MAAYLGGDVLAVVIDDVVRAELARLGHLLFPARGGDDAAMVELGDLDRGRTDAARGGEHEHILAEAQRGARGEHVPRGEENQRHGGGFLEAHVVRDADRRVLGRGHEFGVAAIDAHAEQRVGAAEVVVAGGALLALAAAQRGGEQDAPARLHTAAQFADGHHFAGDIAAEDARHGNFRARDALPDEQVEVIERGGAHAQQDLVGLDGGLGDVFVRQHLRPAVTVNSRDFHLCQANTGGALWVFGPGCWVLVSASCGGERRSPDPRPKT